MSLDIWLQKEGEEESCAEFNYTYNVGRMWYAACPEDDYMVKVEGLTGAQSLPKLEKTLGVLKADPEKFEEMNPPNGWGSYSTFVDWLERVILAAKEYPDATWKAWR